MGKVEKVSVALTPEMAVMVRQAVESGEYASVSEIMREALRDWRIRRAERARVLHEIGRLWDEGLASGAPLDGPAAFGRLRERIGRSAVRS